jgi:Transposase DDE domain
MQPASSLDTHWPDLVAAVSAAIDLEATARSSGALVRRRGIRSAEAVRGMPRTRLALAYGPGGLSLRGAAAWAGVGGLADLSDTAVMVRSTAPDAAQGRGLAGRDRRRAAAPRRAAAAPATVAGPLPGRRLRIVDGSAIARPGGKGAGWRLHATYDPVAGRLRSSASKRPRIDRRPRRRELRTHGLAGRGRGARRPLLRPPAGAAASGAVPQTLAAGADFVVRTGWARLRLLGADGAPMAWEPLFDALAPGEATDRPDGRGRLFRTGPQVPRQGGISGEALAAVPPTVLRLPPAAAERATAAVRRKHRRHYARHQLLPLTVRSAGYLMLLTSLPPEVSAAQVLAAYRLRWQAELAFRRLKGLLGLGRLPARGEALARSWLLAHRRRHASDPCPADRGRLPGSEAPPRTRSSPGRSPLRGSRRPDSPVPSRSGASCKRCATPSSRPFAAY